MKQSTFAAMQRYLNGIAPGGFLMSVLTNDLFGAMGRADAENLADIVEICRYVYNDMPSVCWGSPQKVADWLKARRVVEPKP